MNNQLQAYARKTLKEGLSRCTDQQKHVFKLMYSHKNLNAAIDDVVDAMDEAKLDWAMIQIEETHKFNRRKA